jgi:4-hydroxymandelate oxidase
MDLDELESHARERMDPTAYDYYAGGSESETTLRDNVAAWDHWRLRPHVLRDVSHVSTATTLLGTAVDTPIVVAPTAYHRLAHPDGERATARGAADAGALMIVSTLATTSLTDVAASAPDAPRWFQLYVFDDRGFADELVDRAVASGYRALVLTVDAPVLGMRLRDERNRFTLPDGVSMANLPSQLPEGDGSGLSAFFARHDKRMTFDDLAALKERSGLPLVIKGIHRGDDAARCVEAGADAVVVSNHGGRQVDSAVATADVLPEVVEAVAGRGEVYVDGGVRRGSDVVKALAIGARAVLLGRPVLWGLAAGGADGVRDVLTGMTDLLARNLTMCGVPDVRDVPRDLVTRVGG